MLAICELQIANLVKLSIDFEKGEASMGQIARAKGMGSRLGREVVALARETCGGNGILLENHVIKAFMDMEAIHTYEGT